jgi:hypothetical protein
MNEFEVISPDSSGLETSAAKAERDKTSGPSPSGPEDFLLPVTRIRRGHAIFRTVFGEAGGPRCLICGRVLAPFNRSSCKPFKQ